MNFRHMASMMFGGNRVMVVCSSQKAAINHFHRFINYLGKTVAEYRPGIREVCYGDGAVAFTCIFQDLRGSRKVQEAMASRRHVYHDDIVQMDAEDYAKYRAKVTEFCARSLPRVSFVHRDQCIWKDFTTR